MIKNKLSEDELKQKTLEVIDKIRPYINRDGGEIEFVKIDEGFVYVRLTGACVGCDLASVTIYDGLEKLLVEYVPGIIGVIVDNADELTGV